MYNFKITYNLCKIDTKNYANWWAVNEYSKSVVQILVLLNTTMYVNNNTIIRMCSLTLINIK